MVGPGTGLAPFMSYLHERESQDPKMSRHQHILFFGNRFEDQDFLYQNYLLDLQKQEK
jgi:sulfite reductase alpha subunit-like flavoprotein